MAILRYAPVTNTINPAGAMTIANTLPITSGEDYVLKVIRRNLTAGDIGNNAGQTQDNAQPANTPTAGCLIAQFSGAIIKDVLTFEIYRPGSGGAGVPPNPGTGWNRVLDNFYIAAAANVTSIAWRISADGSALYLKDAATNATNQLAAGDFVLALLVLGNQ